MALGHGQHPGSKADTRNGFWESTCSKLPMLSFFHLWQFTKRVDSGVEDEEKGKGEYSPLGDWFPFCLSHGWYSVLGQM